MSRRFEDNMISKHAWIYWLVSQLFLLGVTIAGCESSSGGNDAGPQCAAGKIYQYYDGLCGKGSSAGLCSEPPTSCDDSSDLACGCDGSVYQTVCDALQGGVNLTFADQCTAPPDTFACVHTYCARNTTFCVESVVESGGGDVYCEPIPSKCASAPSCECLLESYDECESDGMGGLHVTETVYTGP